MAYGAPHEQYFFVDNWTATLQADISDTDTELILESALVDRLDTPDPSSTQRYLATLEQGTTREIVEIIARDTVAATVTVVRACQGTTAVAFTAGTKLEMRPTAALGSLLGIGGVDANGNIFIGPGNPGGALPDGGGAGNIFIGGFAGAAVSFGGDNTVVGNGAFTSEVAGTQNVALGSSAMLGSSSNTSCIAVGHRAGEGTNTHARVNYIGAFAKANAAGINDGLALGYSARLRASNQVVIGSGNSPLTDVYIGEGVIDATPPAGVTINATGGSGTNIAGAPLRLAGGKGTGSAAGGKVVIATAAAGASGATLNALTDRAEWDSAGLFWTYAGIKTGDPGAGAGEWRLGTFAAGAVTLDTANYVEVSIDGTVRKLLVAA